MFEPASLSMEAKAHVKVGATFVNVTKGAVLPFFAFFPHEVWTNLKVVTEIAFVPVSTRAHTLEFIARFNLALVVRMRTIVREATLSMDELLADSICSEFIMIRLGNCWICIDCSLIKVKSSCKTRLILLWVHCG